MGGGQSGVGEVSSFLLELRSEEIPARMQAGARAELEKLLRAALAGAGVAVGDITVWSTPRRLALIAHGLPAKTAAVSEELKGPRTSAPSQALEGFLRKTGLAKEQLIERDGIYYAIINKPGRPTAEVLAQAIPQIIRKFVWPKSMRWGAASLSPESLRWVRPLQGIVALLDDAVVACEIDGIASGRETMGHRFHSAGQVEITSPETYAAQLREAHVIVDHAERAAIIRARAAAAAQNAGLTLVEDEALVVENAGLTEWPVPLLGRFDETFLEVPPEVIQLTARINQKYFVCEQDGKLANAFICTANIAAKDGGAGIIAGNRKVLAARLSDARFFWRQDRKKTLEDHARGLARITFHEKLGTVADKVARVAKLARWLAEEGIVMPSPLEGRGLGEGAGQSTDSAGIPLSPEEEREKLATLAEQAALLCKADLTTEMVSEFPELQGLMGGYYARAEGLDVAVTDAIREHYKPVGQGDDVPTAPVTVCVALADKLDTLFAFFAIGETPTGSRDPFALRRASIGIISLLVRNNLRMPYFRVMFPAIAELGVAMGRLRSEQIQRALAELGAHRYLSAVSLERQYKEAIEQQNPDDNAEIAALYNSVFEAPQKVADFLFDRLKVQQREAGVRHDLIDAVFALGGEDDLVRLLARVRALQVFITTEDGANLFAGYKRAANILKKETYEPGATNLAPEPAEVALIAALAEAEPRAATAIAAEDFTAAMAALASLRAPIDAFFDGDNSKGWEKVTVNDADPAKRAARLALLDNFRAAVHKVADFSRIEG